jgi:hypothetical protein
MKVEILTTYERERDWGTTRRRQYKYDRPDYPSRVFLEYGETVLEHLMNRRSRPWQQLKPVVADKLKADGINVDKLRWSINAGCGMCPCSGGFFIDGEYGTDYFVKVLDI